MFRLLFWFAVIALAVWAWRRFNSPRPPKAAPEAEAAPMVRCAVCGVHVPKSQALTHENRWYCGQPHLQEGSRHGE
ncbi:PP0621 family protein [Pseudomonas sp. LRF_L74]|uniref:PP0621 family protein n=1 Tax=Pseudomonas sp. LRF_L74 TaxID=3369422 RepID=UPI003F5D878A